MAAQLSRLATLGIAKEAVVGTYLVPTMSIPFDKATYEDMYTPIKDQSIRGNDSVLQGVYQGPVVTDWSIDCLAYPDVTGHFLRGVIGPDVVTAGITTTLSASTTAGATTITTAASIAMNSYIQIDTAAVQEYAKVTAVTGVGPYTLTVTGAGATGGLLYAHTSAVAIVSQTTHTFKQNASAAKATYSLTTYDPGGGQTLGYSGSVMSDLQIKIDPKAAVSLSTKLKTFPTVVQSSFVPAYTALDPVLGWEWQMTNGGGVETRGLTFDATVKRAVDDIHSSDGVQAPREIFQGALEVDGTMKSIFDSLTDINLYVSNTQLPAVASLQQPIAKGAASLSLTMSKAAFTKGVRDWSGNYVMASYSLSGVYNTTDAGSVSAVLSNFTTTAY